MDMCSRIWASLVGGAIGDALGAPVEVFGLNEILSMTSGAGITEHLFYDGEIYRKMRLDWAGCAQTGKGVATDDTCMVAATTAALLVSLKHKYETGDDDSLRYLYQAYLRWAQHHQQWVKEDLRAHMDTTLSWPSWFDAFCFKSGAGKSTLIALGSGRIGSIESPMLIPSFTPGEPPIPSNGSAGMMRVAPIGWFSALGAIGEDPYLAGRATAAITHGGVMAQTASGALALLIAELTSGAQWDEAIGSTLQRLRDDSDATTLQPLASASVTTGRSLGNNISFSDIDRLPRALQAAHSEERSELFLTPSVLVQALAIGAASQCWAEPGQQKFRRALSLAVTHSGDSDTVASIVGNILGAQLGADAIPHDLMIPLQTLPSLKALATDVELFISGTRPERTVLPKTKIKLEAAKLT